MTEQTSHIPPKKAPTASALFMPGGGILVDIILSMLVYLEELTGLPTRVLFPNVMGVSGSATAIIALWGPTPMTAKEFQAHFRQSAPKMLPNTQGRIARMLASNISNATAKFVDPNITDIFRLGDIRQSCAKMREIATTREQKRAITRLENLATRQWQRKDHPQDAFAICDKYLQTPEFKVLSTVVLKHVQNRAGKLTKLGRVFGQAVLFAGSVVNKVYANEPYIDASVQKDIFEEAWGATKIADLQGSVFISAQDILTNSESRYFCLKEDVLDPNCKKNVAVSSINHTGVDALMSTTAHPMAFAPHKTKDGQLCTDSSVWYDPTHDVMRVKRQMTSKNPDAKLDFFILNTGNDVLESLDLAATYDRMVKMGLVGNVSDGTQTAMISGFIMSRCKNFLREELGDDAILEITPRLIHRTMEEAETFPSRDVLDTGPANMHAVARRGQGHLIEEDSALRRHALRAVDNAYSTGALSEEDYVRIREKVITDPPPQMERIETPAIDIWDHLRKQRESRLSWRVGNWVSMMFMAATAHIGSAALPEPANKNIADNRANPTQFEKPEDRDLRM